MGSMQFLVPRREGLTQLAVRCAYLLGNDGTPWQSRVSAQQNRLTVARDVREAARLVTPWTVPGSGCIALSTASLVPRDEPYHLALELCRGTLSRIHTQLSPAFLEDPSTRATLAAAHEHFIRAALRQRDLDESAREADMSLAIGLDLIRRCLTENPRMPTTPPVFSSRLTGFQVRGQEQLAALEHVSHWPGNAMFYQGYWRQVELNPNEWNWRDAQAGLERAKKARRRIVGGPLFRLERNELPDWLYLWEDDFDALQSYLCAYIRAAVERLHRWVNVWFVTSGTNVGGELHLDEEQRLRLTLAALETLRQVDAQTPALVGIKQPWGEYLGRSTADLSPLQFADIIVRSGLNVSGFVLELDIACDAGRTLPRDLLELNRLVEQWSHLGLPLVFTLALSTTPQDGETESAQRRYAQDVLRLLHQKSSVQGIIWGELLDRPDWQAGLLQANGKRKAIWSLLRDQWKPGDAAEPPSGG
jgi:hypothetical protein